MIEDPIVAEVRKYREQHAATYGHDLRRIVAALREREKISERPVLNPGPKYILGNPEANIRLKSERAPQASC
jgi:hypothetical protein